MNEGMTDRIRQQISAVSKWYESIETQMKSVVDEYEANGHRVISAGQTSGDEWEVTDYRTGKVILEGDGGYEGFAKALEKADPDHKWANIDHIRDEIHDMCYPIPVTEGLPESLCEKLTEWVENADPDEIAMVLGQDLKK